VRRRLTAPSPRSSLTTRPAILASCNRAGQQFGFAYDALGRLTSVGADTDGNGSTDQALSLYDYDALSQLTGIRRGTGSWSTPVTATDIAWEPDGDLDALTRADP
jgi:YD repeat-containing protein